MWSSKRVPDRETRRLLAAVTRYTRVRVRSTHEVRAYLQRHQASPPVLQHLLDILTAQGLLDDRAAARLWAEQWARRGYAAEAIRVKLSMRGFEDRTIAQVTTAMSSPAEEIGRAHHLVSQRSHRGQRGDQREAGRVRRLLVSRGFDVDVIEQVLGNNVLPPSAS